ncbi:hypothetical protein HZA86_02780 [Candidatus Uhrbacteria bacterium]|nr:hypothetical protein [Candidatus Uhrbacteria bacterium]
MEWTKKIAGKLINVSTQYFVNGVVGKRWGDLPPEVRSELDKDNNDTPDVVEALHNGETIKGSTVFTSKRNEPSVQSGRLSANSDSAEHSLRLFILLMIVGIAAIALLLWM